MSHHIELPLTPEKIALLQAGQEISLSGEIFSARDQAHQRLFDSLCKGDALPVPLINQVLYYMGPSPTPPEGIIGSAGPTTSGRMDPFTPTLLNQGLAGMIGKGPRNKEVLNSIKKNKSVYFYAFGGCGALYAQKISHCELVAYEDLGPEAIYKLTVNKFPLIVAVDSSGRSLY